MAQVFYLHILFPSTSCYNFSISFAAPEPLSQPMNARLAAFERLLWSSTSPFLHNPFQLALQASSNVSRPSRPLKP
ncbi:hypothetical protein BCR34DRAFT_558714 [Clohesyomyces aquaticus]|uniref:Uncharacterized protein n=1 Tax=Clohesyomyces aquaticus TaxID=1231657 RepID=A0A1Y1ZZF0_9PLEO|nr:hypothetical protein BCR34DRAFT_558714 [Clohesyomyces aquaticus]